MELARKVQVAKLVESIKSGRVIVTQNNVPQIEVKAQNKKIEVNISDKELIKDVMSGARQASGKGAGGEPTKSNGQLKSALDALPQVKDIAEDLRREGVTVVLAYQGEKIATVGAEANPKLTWLLTGTKAIEINNTRKLLDLAF